jgi:hypothetical protein
MKEVFMKKRWIIVFFVLLFFTFSLFADEGMYLPFKIPAPIMKKMKAMGLTLNENEIFSSRSPSLSQASIIIDGGTGSFVSSKGLILTNHHVAFMAAQRQSSLKANLIEKGFLAKSLKQEIPAPGYKAYILKFVNVVTAKVLRGVNSKIPPKRRYKIIEKNIKKIIKKEEGKSGDYKCRVNGFYGGVKYYLSKYLVIRDIRIVYIPSRNIGEFGGETDNWMWPRHTGDFSFLRAYVSPKGKPADYSEKNIPYQPKIYLKFSARDIDAGDFAMVLGYPGRTERFLTSEDVKYYIDFYYPEGIRILKKWLEILESDAKTDKRAAIKNAGMIKGLSNAYKNYQGMLQGLKKMNLVQKKEKDEKRLIDFVNSNQKLKKEYGAVLHKLFSLIKESQKLNRQSRFLSLFSRSSRLLSFALTLNKWSIEKRKKDINRDSGYMKRDIPNLKLGLKLGQMSLYIPSDKKIMKFFLKELLNAPESMRSKVIEHCIKDKSDSGIEKFIDTLYKNTKLQNISYRMRAFDFSRKKLLSLNDSFINLASKLQVELDRIKDKSETLAGKILLVRRKYMKLLLKYKKGVIYPDANRTLRLNFGIVKGYSPKDAVWYYPQTTLKGVMEKDTGKWPFNVPNKIKEICKSKDFGNYIDPELKMVPVDFLTTNDSTGGNSGSPLINRYGELMGLLFDGNFESIAADFSFLPSVTRTISVDSRYILFVTDKVDHAENVLKELVIVR